MHGANLIDLNEARRVVEELARDDLRVRGAGPLAVEVFVTCRRTAEHDARCAWRATGYRADEASAPMLLTCTGETRVSVVDGALRPRRIHASSRMCAE